MSLNWENLRVLVIENQESSGIWKNPFRNLENHTFFLVLVMENSVVMENALSVPSYDKM